jgi:sterol desaturase/sphingolipid hydroxylase (fatty acid hydroxylase superfamily)
MHAWPPMWRVHQIHHSDPFVDVTTTYRTHPVETVWRFLFAIVPIWAHSERPCRSGLRLVLTASRP